MTVNVYKKRLKYVLDKVCVYSRNKDNMQGMTNGIASLYASEKNEAIRKVYLYKEKIIPYTTTTLNSPCKIAELMFNLFEINYLAEEYLYMLAFNSKNDLLGIIEVSHGGVDCTQADVREIWQNALLMNATGIIVVHNHPSGHCEPSKEDEYVKIKLQESSKILSMRLLDFIILGKNEYYSASEQNQLY